jgi:hypothetical protein
MSKKKRNLKPKFTREVLGENPLLELKIPNIKETFEDIKIEESYVYFIKSEDKVKIGYSKNVKQRLVTLQTNSPNKLDVLFVVRGTLRTEKYLQNCFKNYHILNEWYNYNPEVFNKQFVIELLKNKDSFLMSSDKNSVKIYTKSELRLKIMSMSKAAKELYLWLIYELDKNEDHVWINVERFMEECSISSMTTYRTTVKELQKNVIIYPTIIKDIYWINPLFFFNGNRIDKYETKVKTI